MPPPRDDLYNSGAQSLFLLNPLHFWSTALRRPSPVFNPSGRAWLTGRTPTPTLAKAPSQPTLPCLACNSTFEKYTLEYTVLSIILLIRIYNTNTTVWLEPFVGQRCSEHALRHACSAALGFVPELVTRARIARRPYAREKLPARKTAS